MLLFLLRPFSTNNIVILRIYCIYIAKHSISELERITTERIQSLESTLAARDGDLETARNKEDDLLKRVSALSSTENELREKVHASEKEFGDRIRASAQRERDLTDKINQLHKQLELQHKEAETKERSLEEKLNLSQDEIVVLRNSKNASDMLCGSPIATRSTPTQPRMLQEEIESLRCVLDMKQREISDLRKQNNELQTAADALPSALLKVTSLESRMEDLQIQLKAKCEEEK